MNHWQRKMLASREPVGQSQHPGPLRMEAEGGCGVVGFAASVPVTGRHIFEPSKQMRNRGNGKGGGLAAAGLDPEALGVDRPTLDECTLLQIALLDPAAEQHIEADYIASCFDIRHRRKIAPPIDHRELELDVRPPDVLRYFVRVRPECLEAFARKHDLTEAPPRAIEDEFIYRNSLRLNRQCYAALGRQTAFVLSHARDLMIFKIVGYAEQVVQYYQLDDFQAHIWIAHQRYPTKGRVWHPAGAHPFIGMNEALVHNGDFANYHGVSQYLRQQNIEPMFLTDTEVSALLYDLLTRSYGYPLEYAMEALAPTTELDFDRLPDHKKPVYRALQRMHLHASPDGPWFFIIAATEPAAQRLRLIGITDTSMLRPQVFALQEGEASIGLVASEKQAIDTTLHTLASGDARFRPVADRYWNARGGSHTDGGAFIFTLEGPPEARQLTCTDKFGNRIQAPPGHWTTRTSPPAQRSPHPPEADLSTGNPTPLQLFERLRPCMATWDFSTLHAFLDRLLEQARQPRLFETALQVLTLLQDRRYHCGHKKRSALLALLRHATGELLEAVPLLSRNIPHPARRLDWTSRGMLRAPAQGETLLVIHARHFPQEGSMCDARLIVEAYRLGWRRFMVYDLRGQRFHGCGLGPGTSDVRIDLYGSSGDYLASGIDGLEMHLHDSGQDQLGQIMKSGRLVIHGDVGQAFLYGAKGGEVYVMGNTAGRPLINAAGRPRVVINGTCLDFLAESFMAGDPHQGGGFIVLNGIAFDDQGRVREQATPYPGSNLFSLASGGALFVRDPHGLLLDEQLNGGEFAPLTEADWALMLPLLETNEKLFGISIEHDLLTVEGKPCPPHAVYRKVRPVRLEALAQQLPPE